MANKALYLLLLMAPALSVSPPRNYLLRTSTEQKPSRPKAGQAAGQQLILTDYLQAGRIQEAQNLSRVKGSVFPEDIPSYSGFFTVNQTAGSNSFFWFFPAENDYENAPVVLWLQGGPGGSSLVGLFSELGPFSVAEDTTTLVKNPYSWHRNHSLLFIDNPVGSGFSYTTRGHYASEQTQIGNELYAAMLQFFTLFPDLQKNDFFVTGESYAGKYVPALGHTINQNNANATLKINLKGLIIGDGLTDPVHQLDYSDYVYQVGLVDNSTWSNMKSTENRARQAIQDGDYDSAFDYWSSSLSSYQIASGLGYYNIINGDVTSESYVEFLERESTRLALHVGSVEYNYLSDIVYNYLQDDMMKSVKTWVEEVLDAGYRVVFYNGQLDVIVAYPLSANMFQNLHFKDADAYRTARRNIWEVNGRIAGYTKKAGGLTEILVRDAGHMVPADQPAVAFQLIYQATRGTL